MKFKLLYSITVCLMFQFGIANLATAQYKYDKSKASQTYNYIQKNRECKSAILSMSEIGLKEREAGDVFAKITSIQQDQLHLMARAGITELMNKKLVSGKEHKILMNILHDDGYNKDHYQSFVAHTKYSTDIAKNIFKEIKEETPPVTSQKRKKRKRGGKWFKTITKIIFGALSAAAGYLTGGFGGAIKGFIIGWNAASKIFKNWESSFNNGGGNGVMPGPNGEGDYMPHGGWPYRG